MASEKAAAQSTPPLKSGTTLQSFRDWRARYQYYATMIDLANLPQTKQIIQLRMCLSLETQRLVEHTQQISPTSTLSVDQVLDKLQANMKNQRNEVLCGRELLSCRQMEGEFFEEFAFTLGCWLKRWTYTQVTAPPVKTLN